MTKKNKDKFVVWEIYSGQDSKVAPKFLVLENDTKRKHSITDDIRTAKQIAQDLNNVIAIRGAK